MQEINNRFGTMAGEYQQHLENLGKMKLSEAFADADFFTLEPFNAELYNIDTSTFSLHASQDQLSSSSVFHCFLDMSEKRMYFYREWLGKDVYYDCFFEYSENTKTRLVYHVKNETITPIALETLYRDDSGRYVSFAKRDLYYCFHCDYTYKANRVQIHKTHYDEQGKESFQQQFLVTMHSQPPAIRFIHSIEGKDQILIYDGSLSNQTLEHLLALAQKQLTQDILQACQDPDLSHTEMHCLLLEFTMQGPFPPTLAFAQTKEVSNLADEHPLAWLNAPDLELFMEINSAEGDSLYQQINGRIAALTDAEYQQSLDRGDESDGDGEDEQNEPTESTTEQLIFAFYVKLCKSLTLKLRQLDDLNLTPQFYACARDFEQCNEVEFLQAILPKRYFSSIQKSIGQYEREVQQKVDANPYKIAHQQAMELAGREIHALIKAAKEAATETFYSELFLYHIEPFGCEIKSGKHYARWQDQLSRQIPDQDYYYRYHMQGDTPLSISQMSKGKIVRQWYWQHTQEQILKIEWYCCKGEPHIESCAIARLENGLVSAYTRYSLLTDHYDYQYADGKIIAAQWRRIFQNNPESATTHRTIPIFYQYSEGRLEKIYRHKQSEYDEFHVYFPRSADRED
ncbi:MAG TPA: hypothetical protein VN030_13580 [Cellvibrio sp.]|nr:hypothetical protein [Cellvibrio sp.]